MDWNVFFSSIGQAVGGIVGIFAAFIITKIINNQSDFGKNKNQFFEITAKTQTLIDKVNDRYFRWYIEQQLELDYESVESKLEDKELQTAEQFYISIGFPEFVPREEVLSKIRNIIDTFDPNPPRNNFDYLRHSSDSLRMNSDHRRDLRNNLTTEKELIDNLITEIKHHNRIAENFLISIQSNPESSSLIAFSIVSTLILFFFGVIYPFSFLPVDSSKDISFSILAFFTILFSLKGLMLFIPSLIFTIIMIVFFEINRRLKYSDKLINILIDASKLEKYSDYFAVMIENQKQNDKYLNNLDKANYQTSEELNEN